MDALTMRRHDTLIVYIADESVLGGSKPMLIGDGIEVHMRGTKDVYYFNMKTGALHVYRAKLKEVQGCLFVRNRDEYNTVYGLIAAQRFYGMPENMFDRLDREWEENHK
jgi:hypothetical protein